MKQFSLWRANVARMETNSTYPIRCEITSIDDLKAAAQYDIVPATFKDSKRSNGNFLQTECIIMDIDNAQSDDPASWITPDDVALQLPDVAFMAVTSRNHMKVKNGKTARPKWHFFLPVSQLIGAKETSQLLRDLKYNVPAIDDKCLDIAHFLFASPADAETFVNEGALYADQYFEQNPQLIPPAEYDPRRKKDASPTPSTSNASDFEAAYNASARVAAGEIISEGSRNATLHAQACRLLMHYGDNQATLNKYLEIARRCNPPLPKAEVQSCWKSAQKHYASITARPDYFTPEEYKALLQTEVNLTPPDFSDAGEAIVYGRMYNKIVRYSEATKWIVYNGRVWREDNQRAQALLNILTVKQLAAAEQIYTDISKPLAQAQLSLAQAGKDATDELRQSVNDLSRKAKQSQDYIKFLLAHRDGGHIRNVIQQAAVLEGISFNSRHDGMKILDSNPYLLNTPNGTYDLETGEVYENRPEDLCTKITAVSPSDEGKEIFGAFLEKICCGDRDLAVYLQGLAGKAAIGMVGEEGLTIAYGAGANGKSTFFNLLRLVLGEYATSIPAGMLTLEDRSNQKAALAELRGKRLAMAAELREHQRLDTAMVKQLTSTDPINAERKYCDPFTFVPSHTVVLFTNHLPTVGTMDDGTWRRLTVVPFNARFETDQDADAEEGKRAIANYAEILFKQCGGYVMKWIIAGAIRYVNNGMFLRKPRCVIEATEAYRQNNDWLTAFIEDCCTKGADLEAPSQALYNTYKTYAEGADDYVRKPREFRSALEKCGYKAVKRAAGTMIQGVSIAK